MIQLVYHIQLFCQVVAIICAGLTVYYISGQDRRWWLWLAGPLAFSLMFLRRLTAFMIEFRVGPDSLGRIDRLWLPAAISVLMLAFILQVYRFVERVTRDD